VTRDPSGTPGADDARGPLGPRHLAASRFPLGLAPPEGEAGSVPGFEFEGRHSQPPRRPRQLPPAAPPPPEPSSKPKRFRYTSTVSQALPVSQPWPENPPVSPNAWLDEAAQPGPGALLAEPARSWYQPAGPAGPAGPAAPGGPVVPGFEFDQRVDRSALFDPDLDVYSPVPPASRPGGSRPGGSRPGDSRPRDSRAGERRGDRRRRAETVRSDLPPASTEWARLLRAVLPQPPKQNWSTQFRAGLHFRGWPMKVGVPILAMIIFGVAVVVFTGANSGNSGPAPSAASLGFPPATLAGRNFTVAPGGRGISQTLDRVASDGTEIVAVGSQNGARIARAQFFVSPNGGHSWTMGSVRTPSGGEPPPGHPAKFVAGGQGTWVAVGPGSIWTSTDGRTWTLSPSAGMPLLAGDQISQLSRTSSGFIAVGANLPGGDPAASSPVIFRSADGISWQRLDAKQLGLPAGTGRVLDIKYAATSGKLILIAGNVSTTNLVGKAKRAVTVQSGAAWLSSDNGSHWVTAAVPVTRGAQAQIAGVAAAGDGFVLARPATVKGSPAVDVYRSADGTAWTFAATLATPAGLVAGPVDGGPDGAVVTGRSGTSLTAFVSSDGASWQQTGVFGAASSESVSGAAMTRGGAVVTGTTAAADTREPAIALVAGNAATSKVDVENIPGAFDPQVAVNSVAPAGDTQVAVGSADGYPAAWASADGGATWVRASGTAPAALSRPGTQQLTSVTHGAAGWLAAGGVVAGAPPHPVVLRSRAGSAWDAVDGEAAFGAAGLVTEQAAAGPGGYVIVGHQDIKQTRDGRIVSDRTVAAAWWSAGLTGFQRAQDATPGALDGASVSRQMLAVTASAKGFVAVGSAGNQASAWTSPDGRTWRQASLPVPMGSVRTVLQHVASRGRAIVAVGTAVTTTGQRVPFAASSSDGGFTWTESALPVPAGQASVTALAADGSEFTAAGMFGRTAGQQDVVLWTSADGATWKAVTPAGQGLNDRGIQEFTALTASGSTLTGVGYSASPASEQPFFWQSPIR
jgi:hypothetical protein